MTTKKMTPIRVHKVLTKFTHPFHSNDLSFSHVNDYETKKNYFFFFYESYSKLFLRNTVARLQ